MTLLNPAALIFAALAPVIILLYLLKMRRLPAQVSTLMFWQRVTADRRRRALFQRLRQVLSLLLHLLIFALILLALARPELRIFRGDVTGLSTVVILDCRARMQAREPGGETRFAQARRVAESYLRRASAGQPVALLAAGSAPRAVVGLTSEEKALLNGLETILPTDSGGRIEDALSLADELLASRPGNRRVVVVTDRMPLPPEMPRSANAPEMEWRLVGAGPRENVGITRLTARALPNSPQTDEVLVETENFGQQRQTGNVELSFEGQILDVKPFDLAPGERRADIYPALAARTGLANARGWLTAHLALKNKADDALALDDDAYAVIPPPQPLRVLLITKGNWFLEGMLKADDQLQFDQLTPEGFQPALAANFDAVILDDSLPAGFDAPDRLPPGNFLFLRRTPLDAPGGTAPPLDRPAVTDTDAASPLLRLVNLRDVTFLRATALTLPDSMTTLGGWRLAAPLRSFDHALAVTGERPIEGGNRTQRLAALAFGPADSDLPLRVAFPLLIHNALDWLSGHDAASSETESAARAGETLRILTGESLWTRPQRAYQPLSGNIPPTELVSGPGVWQPAQNGFYLRRKADGTSRWMAVNTSDREMSALNAPAAADGPGHTPSAAMRAPAFAAAWWDAVRVWPPWVYLALAAFALCTLEWWGFHRRRTE
jgi:hypothetical protein